MDLFAAFFGSALIAVSLILVYRFGIGPEREEKKRQSQLMENEIRRRRREAARARRIVTHQR